MDQQWTNELPTTPGWYWVKEINWPIAAYIVEVIKEDDGEPTIGGELTVGGETLADWMTLKRCQWAGPIPLPREAQQ